MVSTFQVKNGSKGSAGNGIDHIEIRYGYGSSGTTPPNNWSSDIPSVPAGQYL